MFNKRHGTYEKYFLVQFKYRQICIKIVDIQAHNKSINKNKKKTQKKK